MNRFYAIVLLFASLTLSAPAFTQQSLPDFTQIAEQSGTAVVNVSTTQTRRQTALPQMPQLDEDDPFYEFFRRFQPRGGPREFESNSLGSGFIISADGYVLTNAHVVDSADEITVKLNDKREYKAKVIGADRRTDIALLKIEAANLPVVRFGDPSKLKVGEWVVAIGSPFGFDNTVTAGIVSAKGRSLPQESFVPFIQTDVAINPGNSGGPLFNLRGEVVGINSQIYSRTGGFMGLSFSIPIDVALDVQQQLRVAGRVSRGRIGVVIEEVTKELADSFGLKNPVGALVNAVEKGGPAEKAGIEPGDIILKFDGKSVSSSQDLPRLVGATKPGSKSTLQVWRGGNTREVNVVIGEMPDDRTAQRGDRRSPERPAAAANRLGLVVRDLGEDRKRATGLSGGALVDEVRGTSKADVQPGDIIVALTAKGQSTEIKSAEHLNKLLAQIDKSSTLTLQLRRGDNNVFATFRGEANGQ
ncbi:MAG TPA: DegQ family serine endoprotease [Burkholderiales bacterium]|nr:DegQ family serine endoprotease [Burkholderiales bacterium]